MSQESSAAVYANQWIDPVKERPSDGELIEIKYVVVFQGVYNHANLNAKWLVDDEKLLTTNLIAWRPVEEEEK